MVVVGGWHVGGGWMSSWGAPEVMVGAVGVDPVVVGGDVAGVV